jgi:large-conductance mechanosensitive channel
MDWKNFLDWRKVISFAVAAIIGFAGAKLSYDFKADICKPDSSSQAQAGK